MIILLVAVVTVYVLLYTIFRITFGLMKEEREVNHLLLFFLTIAIVAALYFFINYYLRSFPIAS